MYEHCYPRESSVTDNHSNYFCVIQLFRVLREPPSIAALFVIYHKVKRYLIRGGSKLILSAGIIRNGTRTGSSADLEFSRPEITAKRARIGNTARRSPITIASEIYRFTVPDNSILFLHSLSRSFFLFREHRFTRRRQLGNVSGAVPHPRVVTSSAMRTQRRAAAVTLFASARTSMPPDKGINRITSTRERISASEMGRARARAQADTVSIP